MKYILVLVVLSLTTAPQKKCTVYAMNEKFHKIDSLRVSPDSVQYATRMMEKVKGFQYSAIKCEE